MSKADYMRVLLAGRLADMRLFEAALIYWHSSIPLDQARGYFYNLRQKLHGPSM